MLCNFLQFFMYVYKNAKNKPWEYDNYKKLFEYEKIKPLYIPPYQYIPIYHRCSFKLDQAGGQSPAHAPAPAHAQPIISQKLYNAIKYSSIFTNEEYKRPLPVKMKMYV
jgi:hypothetical protein